MLLHKQIWDPISLFFLQDEDFVAEKDDGGSPTDDSGEEDSDASESGDEKEVTSAGFLTA